LSAPTTVRKVSSMNQQEIIAAKQEQLLSAKGMGKSAENLAGIVWDKA